MLGSTLTTFRIVLSWEIDLIWLWFTVWPSKLIMSISRLFFLNLSVTKISINYQQNRVQTAIKITKLNRWCIKKCVITCYYLQIILFSALSFWMNISKKCRINAIFCHILFSVGIIEVLIRNLFDEKLFSALLLCPKLCNSIQQYWRHP